MPSPIKHQVTLSFCEITVHDDYIYVIMNEGVTVAAQKNDILVTLAATYFAERDFIYISHRLYSYSVDPVIYIETAKIPNLKGFVIVNSHNSNHNTSQIERLFFNKPFYVVDTLHEAFALKNDLLHPMRRNRAV